MAVQNILIVEDDLRLARLLREELEANGYSTSVSHNGADALAKLEKGRFSLLLLDRNLPDMDGLDIAKGIGDDAEVLILSARSDVESRVEGLYAGASDYVTKPFNVKELLARIHVRLRERKGQERLVHGELELESKGKAAWVRGKTLDLTAQEYTLLELLLLNRGRIFSKEDIEGRLYGGALPESNTVEVFVSHLRKKLAAEGIKELIRSVRGLGYVIR